MERYYDAIPDIASAKKIHDLGCYFQINAYSIEEERKPVIKKRTADLLEAKLVDFIGSDAYRTDHRPPKILQGVQSLYKKYDKTFVELIIWKNVENLILIKSTTKSVATKSMQTSHQRW